ncbi:MAG: hypothetical protein AB7P76_12200 [Candidatus Melainabacteria bacterium]
MQIGFNAAMPSFGAKDEKKVTIDPLSDVTPEELESIIRWAKGNDEIIDAALDEERRRRKNKS